VVTTNCSSCSDIKSYFSFYKAFQHSAVYTIFVLQTNTFQAAVVSDGVTAFAIFNYHRINWDAGTASSNTSAQVKLEDIFE